MLTVGHYVYPTGAPLSINNQKSKVFQFCRLRPLSITNWCATMYNAVAAITPLKYS